MEVRYKEISLSQQRCILVSDIHAHLDLFKEGLRQVHYKPEEDMLLILGDTLEKGDACLATLHYMMELSKVKNVYILMGNCDAIPCCVVDREHMEGIFHYQCSIPWKTKTLLYEMCALLDITITPSSNIEQIFDQLLVAYPAEFAFLSHLPHVLESDKYIFTHAGIHQEEAPYAQTAHQVMKNDYFALQDYHFKKIVICGHTPVINYCNTYLDYNIHVQEEKNILTIDGGCGVKKSGQLNIVELKDGVFSNVYIDELSKIQIIKTYYPKKQSPMCIVFVHNEVQILKRRETTALCKHLYSGKEMEIPYSFLYQNKDAWYCDDYSDYHLDVEEGDVVGYIQEEGPLALVKKNGILGWIPKECLAHSIREV